MAENIQIKLIEEEMKQSYLDYSMSVIIGRALPDVRDGLKPVHRRILYSMHDMGLVHNKPFVKSARIVGDCFKYHPHGDAAIYDSLVRMAQDFSLRYPLVEGHGNFGSIDGFQQAQMRYTEARLTKIAEELLKDLDKETVGFIPNFDGSLKEPVVMPSRIPNLLINGSSGIAVGMATNIPPHNINEIVDACIAFIDYPNFEARDLLSIVKGPDFPTGGIISGRSGIKEAYLTGRGKIIVKSKTEMEDDKIIVTEIPYQVNKSQLIEEIASLIKDKKVEGISDLRDESDKRGMRIVIKLKKNVDHELVLNQLIKHSQLKVSFGIIMLALVNNVPKVMNLRELIQNYIEHRKEVIVNRTKFDLNKAEEKAHILEGLKIALKNIDEIIKLIKSSKDVNTAKDLLSSNFELSVKQAQAILDMKLQRLTSLEQDKIIKEYEELLVLIKELKEILADEKKVFEIIKKDLIELKKDYGDKRKTFIEDNSEEIETKDLIKEEDVVVILTESDYIKQIPLTEYKQQKRGGQGVITTNMKEEDVVKHIFVTSNHNTLLIFTNKGKVHWLKTYQIPSGTRYSKGKAMINLIKLDENELISDIIPVKEFDDKHYLLMATKKGVVKKTNLSEYANPRAGGIIAITFKEEDKLINVKLTDGNSEIIIGTKEGMAVRFHEQDVRVAGRSAMGVRGITLDNDEVIGMEIVRDNLTLLTVTENGYGKRTEINDYRKIKRRGKGVINIQATDRNGKVIGIKTVSEEDEFMVISRRGVIIRIPVKTISVIGRNTQGVRIMKLQENDNVKKIAKIEGND